jgi:hypothetical protein
MIFNLEKIFYKIYYMPDFYKKYLKYKNKYNELKKLKAGALMSPMLSPPVDMRASSPMIGSPSPMTSLPSSLVPSSVNFREPSPTIGLPSPLPITRVSPRVSPRPTIIGKQISPVFLNIFSYGLGLPTVINSFPSNPVNDYLIVGTLDVSNNTIFNNLINDLDDETRKLTTPPASSTN